MPAETWKLEGSVHGDFSSSKMMASPSPFSLESSAPEMLPEVVLRPSGIPHLDHTGSRK